MPKFQFVGDKYAPETTKFYGVWFKKGHGYYEVTDPEAIAKLRNHPEFKEKVEKKKLKAAPIVEAPKAETKAKVKAKAK